MGDRHRPAGPRRAVVTGASGVLGRGLVQRLSAEGWDVVGVDVRPGPRVVSGDITRPGAWTAQLEGADVVVHAAALLGDVGDERGHWDVNAGGARTVARAAREAGVGRMVHVSTTAVLGADAPDLADEDQPVRMTGNPYTDSAVAAEHAVLAAAAKGLPVVVVRLGDVYGPHASQWTVRPVTLIRRGLFALVDGGQGVLSPTYVDDAVAGVLAAATTPAAIGEVLHITGGVGVSTADFLGRYAAMLGRSLPSLPRAAAVSLTAGAERLMRPLGMSPPISSRSLEFLVRPGTYSIERAERVLGWRPAVDLDEGMARTEAWLADVGLLGSARDEGPSTREGGSGARPAADVRAPRGDEE